MPSVTQVSLRAFSSEMLGSLILTSSAISSKQRRIQSSHSATSLHKRLFTVTPDHSYLALVLVVTSQVKSSVPTLRITWPHTWDWALAGDSPLCRQRPGRSARPLHSRALEVNGESDLAEASCSLQNNCSCSIATCVFFSFCFFQIFAQLCRRNVWDLCSV